MLTAYDVLNQKFAATKFREGYDQDEVDRFLDRVTVTLRGLEGGETTGDAVTADEVGAVRFHATKFREGYDQDEVDDFLDRVRERLTQAPADAPVWQPGAPVDVPAIAATALVMRLQMAHSTRPPGAPDVVSVHLPDGQVRSVVDVRSTPTGIELVLG
ncbi:DivIVA domain-containing protein [Cellulomonas sp. Leaf334]|uniref:DivIVA domain-containing protein n=1 Tax=Cellulomonas sp. Leaf334 TaxID=1736339 RepID=UPI0009E9FF8F